MNQAYYLSAGDALAGIRPALTIGQGLPTKMKVKVGDDEREFPVSYWRKDAIACGRYKHPVTGQVLEVDEKRIDGWVAKFNAMAAQGREIPAPVDHSDKAKDNLGHVIGAERVGDRLNLTLRVIGDDAALVAARNSCSLCIDPNFIDEKGKAWGDAFTHCAFTPTPVVSGMGQFVPFAASRGQPTDVYLLSADEEGDPEMDLKKLREALGAPADVPDDKLIDHAQTVRTEGQAALSRADAADKLAREQGEKIATLSRQPTPPDPEILRDRMELSMGKIDLAVQRGDMPPFIADKLRAQLKRGDRPNVFMLSRADDLGDRPVDFVLSLFDGAKLSPKTGSETEGRQILSRQVPGAANDDVLKAAGDQAANFVKQQLAARGVNA